VHRPLPLAVRAERTRPGGKEALLEFQQERDEERDREERKGQR